MAKLMTINEQFPHNKYSAVNAPEHSILIFDGKLRDAFIGRLVINYYHFTESNYCNFYPNM